MSDKESGNSNKFIIIVGSVSVLIILFILLNSRGQEKVVTGSTPQDTKATIERTGKKAPSFELKDFDGNTVTLESLKGKNAILFFTEGLMCYPACWDQMAKLGTDPRFNNDKVVAYSVIVDQKAEWQKAFDKMPELRSTKVLFDNYRTASKSFDALNVPSSMHRGSYPGHTYFLLDTEGIIRYYFDDPAMGIHNDAIYEELKKLL